MTEQEKTAGQSADTPQFAIERIYVKDVSLETPMGIEAFSKWQPQINLDINTRHNKIDDSRYEVVLRLTVTAKQQDSEDSYFLIEIHQAGLFVAQNFPESELLRLLGTLAPATLFPYAREAIDSLAVKANFPPLRLAPINFDLLWQNAQAQKNSGASQTIQ